MTAVSASRAHIDASNDDAQKTSPDRPQPASTASTTDVAQATIRGAQSSNTQPKSSAIGHDSSQYASYTPYGDYPHYPDFRDFEQKV